MSYYKSAFKYGITKHALIRAKERLHVKNESDDSIHLKLEEWLEFSVLYNEDSNGKIYKNFENNITIVVDDYNKIIKTVY